jgi:class 3 adenylate cyclase
VAHLCAGLTIASLMATREHSQWLVWLFVFSLIYPHLAYWITGIWFNSPLSAWRIQYIDSIFVGLLCGVIQLTPLPVVSLVTSLFISNMVLFGPRGCLLGVVGIALGYGIHFYFFGFAFTAEASPLTTCISGVSIILYGSLIAYLVYTWGRLSSAGKSDIKLRHQKLMVLTEQIKKYVSPQVHQLLYAGKEQAIVHSRRRKLTVFFSDIVGFTELTDEMESEEMIGLLNEYLQEMALIVNRYDGTIDKFMGDGIMIFFGDPQTRGSQADALACVSMAMEMRQRMLQLRKKWQAKGIGKPLHIRMGINTGYCTVGNFGSETRLDYTIIGNCVNIASRLESAAATDEILISRETCLLVRDRIKCLKKPGLRVKGISRDLDIFQVVAPRQAEFGVYSRERHGFKLEINPQLLSVEQTRALLNEALRTVYKVDSNDRRLTGQSESVRAERALK